MSNVVRQMTILMYLAVLIPFSVVKAGAGIDKSGTDPLISLKEKHAVPPPVLTLSSTGPAAAVCGDNITVTLTAVSGFSAIGTLQFSVNWDPTKFQYVSDAPAAIDGDVPLTNTGSGNYIYSWLDETGVYGASLANGTPLATLTLKAIGSSGMPTIDITGSPTVIEATDDMWNDVTVSVQNLTTVSLTGPVQNINTGLYYCTIQAAIDDALTLTGHQINVAAGTYPERVTVSKGVFINGAGENMTILNGTTLVGVGSGFTISNGISGVTIKNLTVRNYAGNAPNNYAGIYAVGGNNNLLVENVTLKDNIGGCGFYANGPVNTVTLNNLDVSGHSNAFGAARGIVIWNGVKSNVTITNCDVYNNNCCGIELQEGSGTNVNISFNNVYDNGDSGMGLIGLTGPGANVISTNILQNNGRFGIEIKNPNGFTTITNNTVSRTNPIGAEVRDIAGIAVFRRSVLSGNVDIPYGATVTGNTVSGYVQPSTSEGFGIVVEGISHTVTGNTVTGNDVGILQQRNPSNYPGDADQTNVADLFFGRGNSPQTCGNTISGNMLSSNGLDTRDNPASLATAGTVYNTTSLETFCSIQAAINDAQTLSGHTLEVSPGTFNEQVIVNKGVNIKGVGMTQPLIDFTGTVSGKPTLFDVSADGVTIDNLHFNVDLSKLRSAVIASDASLDLITVKNNVIDVYGTAAGSYGDRNAVSVNYGGPTNYRVATGGVNNVVFQNNTINGSGAGFFRAGLALDEGGGTMSGNTLKTGNHDILVRFAGNGPVTITGNNLNGGGIELGDQNVAGTFTVSGNTFTAGFNDVNVALLRIKNNNNSVNHIVSGNTFNYNEWAVSLENMNSITLDGNTFASASPTAHAVVFNSKSITTNSNAIVQVPLGGVFINNNFNGTGSALSFLNHDSDNDTYGSFTLGTPGNENKFAATLSSFITFDAQTGPSNGSTFPNYDAIIGTGAAAITTKACWDQNMNAINNTFDVGAGLQLPSAMNLAQRTALENKLIHKPDVACLGLLTYYLPVHNLTQNTYYSTIGAGITAANASDVLELAEWTFNEAVVVDKSLTLQGVDSATVVLNGAGLPTGISGIKINAGITNVTIKKLKIQNYTGSGGNSTGAIFGEGSNSNLTIDQVTVLNNPSNHGIFCANPSGINQVTITKSTIRNHGPGLRGIVIWDNLKTNITITNNVVTNNSCCGIELQDGDASGVTVSGNTINIGVGDNALGLTGMNSTIGANLVQNNTITGGGRFGIEIKNPAGGVTVSGNNVTLSTQNADVRDRAGIAVFRRAKTVTNVDIPNGVTITGNTVTGYQQSSTSEGFGIVIEGTNHTVTGNTVTGCEVGILQQQNPSNYPGDADQSDLADQFFGRGNSPQTCGNTISGNTLSGNGVDTRNNPASLATAGSVYNTTSLETFCTIQSAINDPQTLSGHTLEVSSGTFNEQVIVNKGVNIKGVGMTQPVIDFTGTVSGKPTLFDISADGVTIDNLSMQVDLSKLRSGVIASAAGLDAVTIKNNNIVAYGTAAGSYGDRNAVSVNYGGTTDYRVATGGVNSVVFTGNTVNGTGPASYFRSGISLDEGALTATGNTLTTINHDVLVRFATNGAVTVNNNTFNGGGVELSDQNAGATTLTVSTNTFNGAGAPGTAVLRIKNNYNSVAHVVSGNTFTNYNWGVSLENMNAVTLSGNTFNTTVTGDKAIVVNTKSISSNSNTIVQVPVGATITGNNFNGNGNALSFLNHDSDNDSYGTFTLGTPGSPNAFAAGLTNFVVLDNQTGSSNGSTFPVYPTSGNWPTTMDCWALNMDIQNNTFDVGAGLQLPAAMNLAQRTALENKLIHKPDVACLGLLTYFLPVHNLTQNTYYSTIGAGITAANASDVIELAEWTFNEAVVIDKSLTLQGVDSTTVVLNGTGLPTGISGIKINAGITNVTIKKLKIQNYTGSGGNSTGAIFGEGSNSNLTIDQVTVLNNPSNHGIFCANPSGINQVTITKSTIRNHGPGLRGIVIWDNLKTNITITNNVVTNNSCCGIELQDGDASGVTVSGNTINIGVGDNALGLTGMNSTIGANLVQNNTITGGGRFGIEIKNPAGGVTVSGNNVTLSTQNADMRDRAGIAVLRRAKTSMNVDIPNGVTITGNTVTGYQQSSTSEGFGIVIEGTNHTVTGNTVTGCEVGILQQQNPSNYPGDADQSDLADQYFGRGNSPQTCGNTISGNTFSSNGLDTRTIPLSILTSNPVLNNTTGITYCSIQAAVNAALAGQMITASPGTYTENVTVNKALTIRGANFGNTGCGARTAESLVAGGAGAAFTITSNGVTIDGFEMTGVTGVAATGFTNLNIRNNKITVAGAGINVAGVATSAGNTLTAEDNCITLTGQLAAGNPTAGIAVTGATGTAAVVLDDNTISGAFYGYGLYGLSTAAPSIVSDGAVTGAMQGIALVNTLGGPLLASNVAVSGMNLSSFSGAYPALPAQNFHAGIYTFTTAATTPAEGITLTVSNSIINGTQTVTQASAAFSLADFSTGGLTVQNITIDECIVSDNTNRGVDARGYVNAVITESTFSNNGGAAFGSGGNDGFTILAQRGAEITATNNFIVHPAVSTTAVTALATGNLPANTINATSNSILMNGNALAKGASNSGGNTINATCNWWGESCAAVAPLMVGTVNFEPFLTTGMDNAPAVGFQPVPGTCTGYSNLAASIAGTTTLCEPGLTSVLTGSAAGGLAPYTTHLWSSATPANVTVSPTNAAMTTATSVAQGTSIITYQVTDTNGCTDTETVTFTVTNPTVFPTYTIPGSGASIAGYTCGSTVNLFTDPAACSAFKTIVKPLWADNCSVASTSASADNMVTLTDLGAFVSASFPKGMTIVTFSATDGAGNTTNCTLQINVADNIAPVFSNLPPDITVAAPPGDCSMIVSWTPPLANDNCPGTVTITSTHNPGDSFVVPSVTTVTYTAMDASGNTVNYNFNVTVTGNCIPPVDLSLKAPPFTLNPAGGFTLPVMKDGVISVTNQGATASHELLNGNVKVLVGFPSETVFTSVFDAMQTADNADWNTTPYAGPPGTKMILFTLKPGVVIAAGNTKTITVKLTPVGLIAQKGLLTAHLYSGSGGDTSTSNNYTQGTLQITN